MTARVPDRALSLDHGRSCLLITGAPGAGKSTVSRLVAQSLSRSALLNGDFVSQLVVGGHVWGLGEPPEEAARQPRLCNDNLCTLATNFADAGFTPVIDALVPDGQEFDFYRQALASRRLLLVVLDPGGAVCRDRNETRSPREHFFFDGYDSLRAAMHGGFADVGWWFDTAAFTPAETVRQILDNAAVRAVVGK